MLSVDRKRQIARSESLKLFYNICHLLPKLMPRLWPPCYLEAKVHADNKTGAEVSRHSALIINLSFSSLLLLLFDDILVIFIYLFFVYFKSIS